MKEQNHTLILFNDISSLNQEKLIKTVTFLYLIFDIQIIMGCRI